MPEKLPDSLRMIYCSDNQITKLPEKLPDSLHEFSCKNNKITKLYINHGKIPKSLCYIDCTGNVIEEISLIILKKIEIFNCDNEHDVILKSAQKLLKRGITRIMFKKYILQWVVCKQLINHNFNDCSYIIVKYI